MGFKVTDAVTFRSTGVALAGTEYSIHASFEVKKEGNLWNIEAAADVYAGADHTKKPIDVMHVNLKGLASLPATSAEIMSALYVELKKARRFVGKTIVDN